MDLKISLECAIVLFVFVLGTKLSCHGEHVLLVEDEFGLI